MPRNFTVWSLSDLHLSFGVPDKSMDVFGPQWQNHPQKIADSWQKQIKNDDLVLIAGDISWALKLEQAMEDLAWIDQLPGTKVLIRGNHDYWWKSINKLRNLPFTSLHFIHNDSFTYEDITIGGTRLWDCEAYSYDEYIAFQKLPMVHTPTAKEKENRSQIFAKELKRLQVSLETLCSHASIRIAMTHYPPIGPSMNASEASEILEKYRIRYCLFGHLHNVKRPIPPREKNGVQYLLTSCDYLDFKPIKIL